jgi:hypothetical protein
LLIYNVGDIYYQLCFDRISTTNKNNHLSVEDVVGTIVVNETNFNVSWIYNIDLAKSKLEIFTNVQNFNSSNKSHALICTGLYSFGLIKENDDLYFFDSHSRSPRGKSAVNGKAVQCVEYMFYLLSKLEFEKIKSVINICSSRLKSFANTRVDDLHVYMKCLRGYASYWNTAKSDLLAMIRQLGSPSWFITLSANDLNWPDLIKDLLYAKHCSDNNSYQFLFNEEDVANMTYKEKSQLLHDFPVIAARHFDHRFRKLLNFLLKDEEILGNKDLK